MPIPLATTSKSIKMGMELTHRLPVVDVEGGAPTTQAGRILMEMDVMTMKDVKTSDSTQMRMELTHRLLVVCVEGDIVKV